MKLSFNLQDKVEILELNRKGVIKAIYITTTGVQYEVRYFDEGQARTVYFYEEEITK